MSLRSLRAKPLARSASLEPCRPSLPSRPRWQTAPSDPQPHQRRSTMPSRGEGPAVGRTARRHRNPTMKSLSRIDMTEVTRLTREGRLDEAMHLLRGGHCADAERATAAYSANSSDEQARII